MKEDKGFIKARLLERKINILLKQYIKDAIKENTTAPCTETYIGILTVLSHHLAKIATSYGISNEMDYEKFFIYIKRIVKLVTKDSMEMFKEMGGKV